MNTKPAKSRASKAGPKQGIRAKAAALAPAPDVAGPAIVAAQTAAPEKITQSRSIAANGSGFTGSQAEKAIKKAMIEAKADVGFGNALFIRGEGPALSWDKGIPLTCVGSGSWVWSTDEATDKVVFKLLLNDQVWAQGSDLSVRPGEKIEVIPSF